MELEISNWPTYLLASHKLSQWRSWQVRLQINPICCSHAFSPEISHYGTSIASPACPFMLLSATHGQCQPTCTPKCLSRAAASLPCSEVSTYGPCQYAHSPAGLPILCSTCPGHPLLLVTTMHHQTPCLPI